MARPTKHCRAALLDKATDLFWEKGYRGVSIKDVVAETGALAGSLYAGFGSKDGLFMECLQHYSEKSLALYDAAGQAAGPLEQIVALFEGLVSLSLADDQRRVCLVVNALLEIAPDRPEMAERLGGYARYSECWIRERLEAAGAAGQLAAGTDVKMLAECLAGVLLALQVKVRAGESVERVRGFKRSMLGALLGEGRGKDEG